MRYSIPRKYLESISVRPVLNEHIELIGQDGSILEGTVIETNNRYVVLEAIGTIGRPVRIDMREVTRLQAERRERAISALDKRVKGSSAAVVDVLLEVTETLEEAQTKIKYMEKEYAAGSLSALNFATLGNYTSAAQQRISQLLIEPRTTPCPECHSADCTTDHYPDERKAP